MIFNAQKIKKAAAKTAAFYFIGATFFSFVGISALAKAGAGDLTLEATKKKVLNYLIQKQKKQALQAIDDLLAVEKNKSATKEIREFKINIAKKFLTKEAQEFYEVSINQTLDNSKDAKKNNDDCLNLEPENLDCQIQKIRLLYRESPGKLNSKTELEPVNKFFADSDFNWIKISTEKDALEFKNQTFYKKEYGPLTENKLVKATLEIDRAFKAKNFSRAKEMLQLIEKDFKDWPDIVFFKQNINRESAEDNRVSATEATNLYQMKCKNLSKTISRKYRYDFDLCLRSNL